MADLIDRKELRDALYEADAVTMQGVKIINQFPAVDAVPVVRCRDCKHWHKETLFCDYMPYGDARERVNWYADDFCSYGERKEGAN